MHRHGQPSERRAHVAEVDNESAGVDAPSDDWEHPEGQLSLALNAVVKPANPTHTKTQILDSGASITTVGSATALQDKVPCNVTLRMTRGATNNVYGGECTLIFLDVYNEPVEMCLPAITSPDIEPRIVLVSYHQLLTLGYKIHLYATHGMIRTPGNRVIRLIVRNGTWHFPARGPGKLCRLDIQQTEAHMVQGRGKAGWPVRVLKRAHPAPHEASDAPYQSCIDQESPLPIHAEDGSAAELDLSSVTLSPQDIANYSIPDSVQASNGGAQAARSTSPMDHGLSEKIEKE